MSLPSLARFLPVSPIPQTLNISTLKFASLADSLYAHLQHNPINVENALNSIKPKLDSNCVNQVLHKCSSTNSQMGLRFFVWAGYQPNYRHTSLMYGKVCKLFKIEQNPQVVLDLIEAYRVEKCVVSVRIFKVLLNLCREGKLANEALLILRKMPDFDLRPDTNAYNVVIRLFCDQGNIDMAQKLMGEMGLFNLYPDMITYTVMIKGFCDAGRVEEACRLLKAMRGNGCVPNVVVYSALLDGICRFRSVDSAMELLGEMENGDCIPNTITYTSVVQRFCEKGRVTDAVQVLDRMESCGCAPNRVTVDTLMKGLCKDGHLEEAYRLVDRVGGPSVSYGDCCSSLVVALIGINKMEEAEKLFKRVLASGVKLDSVACDLMIKELYLRKGILDSFYMYDEISKMRWPFSINSKTYSTLLFALCEQNHSLEAKMLISSMLEKGIFLKQPYVDDIIEYLNKFGELELVRQLGGSVS